MVVTVANNAEVPLYYPLALSFSFNLAFSLSMLIYQSLVLSRAPPTATRQVHRQPSFYHIRLPAY
jgi:hypothetical protein